MRTETNNRDPAVGLLKDLLDMDGTTLRLILFYEKYLRENPGGPYVHPVDHIIVFSKTLHSIDASIFF